MPWTEQLTKYVEHLKKLRARHGKSQTCLNPQQYKLLTILCKTSDDFIYVTIFVSVSILVSPSVFLDVI